MNDDNKDLDPYQVILEHVRYEGQLLWQIYGNFLLVHTIFMAFLLQAAFGNSQATSGNRPGAVATSILGLILCIPWLATYLRASDYYAFRMAQARATEPWEWNFLKGAGQKFAEGKEVKIGEDKYRVSWLGRVLRTKYSARLPICAFALVYLIVLVLSR